MERIQPMNELQIQEKVEDLAGKSARILDCEQSTMNQLEEVLLVNGVSISLTGEEGARIKEALMHGEVPPCDLVNNMLIRAGIEKNPVELETTMNVKSCIKTLEHSTLLDSNGVLVDEKMREKEDEDEFKTVNVEIWNTEHNSHSVSMDKSGELKQSSLPAQITATTPPTPKPKPTITTTTLPERGNEVLDTSTTETTTKSNKKSIFSPISIIKSNKSDNKNKKRAQEQAQLDQHQQVQVSSVNVNVNLNNGSSQAENSTLNSNNSNNSNISINNMPSPETKNVSNKNKFLSLFSKGKPKSKDKDKEKTGSKTVEGKSKEKNNSNNSNNSHHETTKVSSGSEGKGSKTKLKNNDNILEENNTKKSFIDKFKPACTLPNKEKETKKQNQNQNANVNYLDPSLSLVHVEIDGVPVRVTYETFV